MRLFHVLVFGTIAATISGAQAAVTANLSRWFSEATAYNTPGPLTKMARPDFLPGHSLASMSSCRAGSEFHPRFIVFPWQLAAYDPNHHLGLATTSHTDNCSVALFRASTPPLVVRSADLSQYRTGRGLGIDSTYAQVLSTYGGHAARHGRHFAMSYSANVSATTSAVPHRQVTLPEQITIVIDDDHVSAITMEIAVSDLT